MLCSLSGGTGNMTHQEPQRGNALTTGEMPLHRACAKGELEKVKALVEQVNFKHHIPARHTTVSLVLMR